MLFYQKLVNIFAFSGLLTGINDINCIWRKSTILYKGKLKIQQTLIWILWQFINTLEITKIPKVTQHTLWFLKNSFDKIMKEILVNFLRFFFNFLNINLSKIHQIFHTPKTSWKTVDKFHTTEECFEWKRLCVGFPLFFHYFHILYFIRKSINVLNFCFDFKS